MHLLKTPDPLDSRRVVIATAEEIRLMIQEKYAASRGTQLPSGWKLEIQMSEKTKVTVAGKEIK
jgi:hypothetical protein